MEDGLLSLKWNNHKSTFFHILSEVRGKHTYTDATLACEGKFYPVHKLVMSTCSDYFAEIFEKTPCKNPVVVLKDIKKSDLDALLDYMYIGEVDVRQSELAGLIKAAECLRIKGLAVPDEDPTKTQKRGPNNVPERREDSPPAKRKRRESGERGRGLHSPIPRGSSHSSSSHHPSTSSSVPSHAPSQQSSVPESLVPSQPMPPPPPALHQESRLGESLRGRSESQSQLQQGVSQGSSLRPSPDPSSSLHRTIESSQSSTSCQRTSEAPVLPVQMIKVEVVDEGADNVPKESHSERGDEVGSDLGVDDEGETSSEFAEYQSHSEEIEKEEHDQMDSYGADQIPGPSGLQGGPPMLGWGDEGEGGFPHNLFGSEDPASQQALHDMAGGSVGVRLAPGGRCSSSPSSSSPHHQVWPNLFPSLEAVPKTTQPPQVFLTARSSTSSSSSSSEAILLASSSSSSTAAARIVDSAAAAAAVVASSSSSSSPSSARVQGYISRGLEIVGHFKRSFHCPYCEQKMTSKGSLVRHIRSHTGERPYKCIYCPYAALQKSDLDRHTRNRHRDLF